MSKPIIRFIETHEIMKGKKNQYGDQSWPQVYETELGHTIKVIDYQSYQRLLDANKKLREGLEMASQEYWNKACSKDNLTWSEFQDAIFQILSEAGKIEGGS